MRVGIVFKFLAILIVVISAWMTVPLVFALYVGGNDALPFLKSIAAGLVLAFVFRCVGGRAQFSLMRTREAMLIVTLSWVMASAISALPYWLHGCAPSYTDAFFEGMSGYSTTGSTILTNIDYAPSGILLWRALTHWLGGMGIIVLALTVMPLVGTGGYRLFAAEVPGMTHAKATPRVQQTAIILWIVYISLTALQTILLLIGGMNLFDAITHSLGTISTGGFSPHTTSVAFYDSAYIDWVITIFMFISGANFILHFHAIKRKSVKTYFGDSEFRFYLLCVASISLVISAALFYNSSYPTFKEALRYGTFQVVSFVTTTGFVSADYDIWPFFCQGLLFVCLFLGGCSGSTSGAIKQIRILTILRHVARQFRRILYPRSVLPLRIGQSSLEVEIISSCMAFFGLYFITFSVGIFLVTLLEPDLFTAISAVAATLGNVGPGFGSVGATSNFAGQASEAKWIYSFLMLCGRLELFTVWILFTRSYWSEGIILPGGKSDGGSADTAAGGDIV